MGELEAAILLARQGDSKNQGAFVSAIPLFGALCQEPRIEGRIALSIRGAAVLTEPNNAPSDDVDLNAQNGGLQRISGACPGAGWRWR